MNINPVKIIDFVMDWKTQLYAVGIVALLVLVSGCSSNLVAKALENTDKNIQVANCTRGEADKTFAGQSNTNGKTCTCTISPDAGLKVTSAEVSADADGSCRMTIAEETE